MNDTAKPAATQRYSPFLQLVLARMREFYREPVALFWVYGFPLLLALALGIAFRGTPATSIKVEIQYDDQYPAEEAEKLATKLKEADARIDPVAHNAQLAQLRLARTKTDLVILVHPGAGEGGKPRYEFLYDPNRPESLLAHSATLNALRHESAPASPSEFAPPSAFEDPRSRYIAYLLPGLIGVNVMGGGLWGIGFVTVDMRVRKLLKRFLATPMNKAQFLLSLMVSRILFLIPEMILLVFFGWLVFGVTVQGSYLELGALILLGSFCFMGLGLLVASRARTMETVSGLMNLVMLPMYMFSGVFFSWERFPEVTHPVIRVLPLTAFNDSLRAVILDGEPLWQQWPQLLLLAACGAVCFGLALRWFRWQ